MGDRQSPQPDFSSPTSMPHWWQAHPLTLNSTLGCIPDHTIALSLEHNTQRAIAHFEADRSLPGILLQRDDTFVGMLSRQRFYELMSRPFSLELFTQRPLQALWKILVSTPFILEADLAITIAARQALQRSINDIYEPIVIRRASQQYGIIDIHSLLLAQNIIHELALEALRASKQALSEEKDLAQITLKSIGDGVITINAEGIVQNVNPVAERLTTCSRKVAIGQSITAIFQPVDEATQCPLPNPVKTVLQTKQTIYSEKPVILRRSGNRLDIQYSASPIFDHSEQLLGVILVFRDVTQQQLLLCRIHWQASHDAMTGLMNRMAFEDQLAKTVQQMLNSGQQSTHILIYLDLDRFKAVNDTCGHFAGDELLRQVGSLLQDCLRDQDLLARLGGDEFGILLNDCGLEQGKKIANRIHQSIQEYRFVWQDYVFSIGASVGVTQIQGDLPAVDALKQADSACYLAKNQGRNQVCYYAQLQQQIACEKPTQLITRITQALTHSQFGMFYQKIFSVDPDREMVLFASEILVRLPGEEGGWIRPDAFLHTAERYNLMTEIDAWVVKTFCQFYRQICQQTQSTQFALNLSGASLNSDRLTSFIRTQLEIHHIPPYNICFEVTETVAITNLSRARALLQELKALGCRIALDDFGSGMSSFHYLRSLPVDYLKIDGSLIRDVDTDRVAQEMVAAIVKIGHEMGLKTIAEWVESDAVTQILLSHQNDYVQGFLHHVPEALSLTSGQI